MGGQRCCVCGNRQARDPAASFHRFPRDTVRRTLWLEVFGLTEGDLKPSTRVCSRHFPEGDIKKMPSMLLGKISTCLSTTQPTALLLIRLCLLHRRRYQ